MILSESFIIAQKPDAKGAPNTASMSAQKGFFNYWWDENSGKIWLEVDKLDQEFLYVNSLPAGVGSNDIGLDRGQLGGERVVKFIKSGPKIMLIQPNYDFRAVSDNPDERKSVQEAFAQSVIYGFKVGKKMANGNPLIDITDFLLRDAHGVVQRLARGKQGNYKLDKSRSAIYLDRCKNFPKNSELEAMLTFTGQAKGGFIRSVTPSSDAVTVRMHHSFIELPDSDYEPRLMDPRSGYNAISYYDYATPIGQPLEKQFIARHRLKKKNPEAAVSEAVEPIIYYLDRGAPEPVRSALLDGARWWNQAFEAIGYKDAFQVKMLPDHADPMDVRYNVIQWVHRSTRGWSYGYGVTDPRTGEIIKGHVTLGSLRVRQDYLIAQGLMAPFLNDENDQALMDLALARIRQLSAHEVGHTIGIAHNFAASNYGRESVMDYPHPQFEIDSNDQNNIIAPNAYGVGLGKWDKAVIAYGYSEFSESQNELAELNSLIEENDRNGLVYVSDADARSVGDAHAYASLWDNGADAVLELEEMISIRKVALNNFGTANLKRGRNWSDLEEILVPVYYFHRFQIQAAAKWLGGVDYDYAAKGQGQQEPKLSVISGAEQGRALDAMLKTLTPEFLQISPKLASLMIPKATNNYRTRESVNGKTGATLDQLALASASAQHTISAILHPQRLARLIQQNSVDNQVPSIARVGQVLHDTIVDTSYSGMQARLHQSVVDLIYSNYLNLLKSKTLSKLAKVLTKKAAKSSSLDGYQAFYKYQLQRLEDVEINQSGDQITLPSMPPGSPI